MIAFMYIFVLYACMVSLEVQRGITCPEMVTMCWKFNLCSLQGKQVLLTSEPSLQPLGYKHIFKLILKCTTFHMEREVSFFVNIHTARGLYPWGSMEPFKWLCSSLSGQTSVCVSPLSLFTLALHPSSFFILSNNSSVLTGSEESEENSMLSDLWRAAL